MNKTRTRRRIYAFVGINLHSVFWNPIIKY